MAEATNISNSIRANAIETIRHAAVHSSLDVHNAVIDLRRNAEHGDDKLLFPLLDHSDEMVVSATLYALFNIYRQVELIREFIFKSAWGDPRDTGEMPIQTEAIEDLAVLAKEDPRALLTLREIAENSSVAEAPRSRAWKCLAHLFHVEWNREDTESMIWDPDSTASELIRSRVRGAIR